MNKILFLLLMTSVWAIETNAQTDTPPSWIYKMPKPSDGSNFYYRVTVTEGTDYKDMYAESFAMAIYESYSKLLGIPVSISDNTENIKNDVLQNITLKKGTMQLKINKACEYIKFKGSGEYWLYVLWQIPNSTLSDPNFDNYNCE